MLNFGIKALGLLLLHLLLNSCADCIQASSHARINVSLNRCSTECRAEARQAAQQLIRNGQACISPGLMPVNHWKMLQ